MIPIPTLYLRDPDGCLSENVDPVCQWVIDEWESEAVRATEKIDGLCCLVQDGIFYRRHTVKEPRKPAGARSVTPGPGHFPPGWWHYSTEPGHRTPQDAPELYGPGWIEVDTALATNQWHSEAWDELRERRLLDAGPHQSRVPDGTYELIGPKIEGNPYAMDFHKLVRHGTREIEDPPNPRQSSLYVFFEVRNRGPKPLQGIVWHRASGEMAKISARNFNIPWPPKR